MALEPVGHALLSGATTPSPDVEMRLAVIEGNPQLKQHVACLARSVVLNALAAISEAVFYAVCSPE
jgi:hypothetical protein